MDEEKYSKLNRDWQMDSKGRLKLTEEGYLREHAIASVWWFVVFLGMSGLSCIFSFGYWPWEYVIGLGLFFALAYFVWGLFFRDGLKRRYEQRADKERVDNSWMSSRRRQK